jgi:DNA-binding transcriptional regulator YhcF (GntR family)
MRRMAEPRRRRSGGPLRVEVDRSSTTPPYEQIVAQVRREIERGALAVGTRVPTVRALAERTGVVANTVAKAYRELEAAGYLQGRGRAGTFVRAAPGASGDDLDDAARAYLERARILGADPAAAVETVRRIVDPSPKR